MSTVTGIVAGTLAVSLRPGAALFDSTLLI
ncbi:MAG: hypothetical protein J07HX64_01661 [halophilic archaeon J07HX64]|nr:MAG: hypothetical protein J07HX64_01661 [halophilic archaeon J07HX64]